MVYEDNIRRVVHDAYELGSQGGYVPFLLQKGAGSSPVVGYISVQGWAVLGSFGINATAIVKISVSENLEISRFRATQAI